MLLRDRWIRDKWDETNASQTPQSRRASNSTAFSILKDIVCKKYLGNLITYANSRPKNLLLSCTPQKWCAIISGTVVSDNLLSRFHSWYDFTTFFSLGNVMVGAVEKRRCHNYHYSPQSRHLNSLYWPEMTVFDAMCKNLSHIQYISTSVETESRIMKWQQRNISPAGSVSLAIKYINEIRCCHFIMFQCTNEIISPPFKQITFCIVKK